MKKILIYIKSDGWKNSIRMIIKSILYKIYYQTCTNFYVMEKKDKRFQNENNSDDLIVRELNVEEVASLDFPRLKLLDYEKWLNNGSHLYVSFLKGNPVGFVWTHQNNYYIHDLGTFILNKNEYWSGPTFVYHTLRGRGINKNQKLFQLNHLPNNSIIFTSINEKNIPSIRSNVRYGFRQIGCINTKIIFGKKKNKIEGSLLKERLALL